MGSPAPALGELLASGKVVWSRYVRREEASPRWEVARLAGRFVEVLGQGASARLTAAIALVREAQELGEPVAWVGSSAVTFFPPDVAASGVDLEALAVIRVESARDALRAADHLLRSGAFGLVVLDFTESTDIPMQAQVRLANLVQKHGSILLALCPESSNSHSRRGGSLASLRATSCRTRTSTGRFSCTLHVWKDKRLGREWEHAEVLDGPMGLV